MTEVMVQREQHPAFRAAPGEQDVIGGTAHSLAANGLDVMPGRG